jgi:hypothetical protein
MASEVARAFVIPAGITPVRVAKSPPAGVQTARTGGKVAKSPPSDVNTSRAEVAKSPPEAAQGARAPIPASFVPSTPEELSRCLADPMWRICSGQLYQIMVKSPDTIGPDGLKVEGDQSVVPFIPNRSQRRLMARIWHRNIILKARQLGFTTLVCILWLDHALFNADQRCVIIAQDKDKAEEIFRDKVKLAYDRLPEHLRTAMPLETDSKSELLFKHNNSSFKVSVSARGGTIHRLHVSEFGKICAKTPDKAKEVVTGSFPAVPLDGITVVESTAEGQDGEFFKMTERAIGQAQRGIALTQKDYRIHFFPWWQEEAYRIHTPVEMTAADRAYFAEKEAEVGVLFDDAQRAWYVATRDADFSGDPEKMWQEYPTTAKEAFQVSTEGVYYALQLTNARKQGRITKVPYVLGVPVNTFWDIGSGDGTAIWFHQRIGFEDRWIDFEEGWGEPYAFYIAKMQERAFVWGTHYLPHDAEHKRQQGSKVASPEDELRELAPGWDWRIVDVVDEVIHGIQKTRQAFPNYFFDAEKCAKGLAHLQSYRKTWNKARGGWNVNIPSKVEGHSEAADAIRQHGQGYMAPSLVSTPPRQGNWRTA